MSNKIINCKYCKCELPKDAYRDHLEYEHGAELRASLARLKVALPIVLVGFSIVLGMVFMGLIN